MAKRRDFDRYETSEMQTTYLLNQAQVPVAGRVLEPCAGTGRMAAVLAHHPQVDTVITADIDTSMATDWHMDATDPGAWEAINDPQWNQAGRAHLCGPFDWIVTNPPYLAAPTIIPLAMATAVRGVAMLVRMTYLEPTEQRQKSRRGRWLARHAHLLSHLIIFGNPRPGFTGNGRQDSITTCWVVWDKQNTGGTQVIFAHDWQRLGSGTAVPGQVALGCRKCGPATLLVRKADRLQCPACGYHRPLPTSMVLRDINAPRLPL